MKKIFFFCNNVPTNLDAGAILYNNIIRCYGIKNFTIVSIGNIKDLAALPNNFDNKNVKQFALRLRKNSLFSRIVNKFSLITILIIIIKYPSVKKGILTYIDKQKFDAIFAPLRGDVLLLLNEILKTSNLPLYAMVEDTVEREIDDPLLIYRYKRKKYYELLPRVVKLSVAGETMKEYFKLNFKIDSTILRPSYSKFSSKTKKVIDENLNVFFAGNIYAKKEMKCFIDMLVLFADNNKNLKINLYIASHRSINVMSNKISIINIGWVEENLLTQFMEKCHISYLPYKSEPAFMHSMKYAFPGKAGYYITNNLPIFFHGPSYSSFNTFLKKYRVGTSCNSFNHKILINKLNELVLDFSFYSSCQQECKKAFEMEYRDTIFLERVRFFFA